MANKLPKTFRKLCRSLEAARTKTSTSTLRNLLTPQINLKNQRPNLKSDSYTHSKKYSSSPRIRNHQPLKQRNSSFSSREKNTCTLSLSSVDHLSFSAEQRAHRIRARARALGKNQFSNARGNRQRSANSDNEAPGPSYESVHNRFFGVFEARALVWALLKAAGGSRHEMCGVVYIRCSAGSL